MASLYHDEINHEQPIREVDNYIEGEKREMIELYVNKGIQQV
jgi:hypothetical protein